MAANWGVDNKEVDGLEDAVEDSVDAMDSSDSNGVSSTSLDQAVHISQFMRPSLGDGGLTFGGLDLQCEAEFTDERAPQKNQAQQHSPDADVRKSKRDKPKMRDLYSPELSAKNGKKKKKRSKSLVGADQNKFRPFDVGPDGRPFCCDICKSHYIVNPAKRGPRLKMSKNKPSPRHKLDTSTGKLLVLCNACGLAFDRPVRAKKPKPLPPVEEKSKYLKEAEEFADSLVKLLQDEDARRLFCPHFKHKPCGCIQRYVLEEGMETNQHHMRGEILLNYLKEAKRLSQQKCYDVNIIRDSVKQKKPKHIGVGNGQRRSKEFEIFVMENRVKLKDDMKLCERAIQRVLMYSNNFLHKKLKTDERGFRASRVKGKGHLGLLTPIAELYRATCCTDNCVTLCLTHDALLSKWRERSQKSQAEARRVLAEMLTPTGGSRSNCYKFIAMVTGCSASTIGSVNEQMKRTGGDREPPEHGLKKYWSERKHKKDGLDVLDGNSKDSLDGHDPSPAKISKADLIELASAQAQVELSMQDAVHNVIVQEAGLQDKHRDSPVLPGELKGVNIDVELQLQRNQLLELREQVEQQQLQLQRQQEMLQQQLVKHNILQKAKQAAASDEQTADSSNAATISLSSALNRTQDGEVQPVYLASVGSGQVILLNDITSGKTGQSLVLEPSNEQQANPSVMTIPNNVTQYILQTPLDIDSNSSDQSSLPKGLFTVLPLNSELTQPLETPVDTILDPDALPVDPNEMIDKSHKIVTDSSGTSSPMNEGGHALKHGLMPEAENPSLSSTVTSSHKSGLVKHESRSPLGHSMDPDPTIMGSIDGISDCESIDHTDSNPGAKAVVQQILDFAQVSTAGTGITNSVSVSPAQMSILLSQLSDTSGSIAPNVNIAYIQHQAERQSVDQSTESLSTILHPTNSSNKFTILEVHNEGLALGSPEFTLHGKLEGNVMQDDKSKLHESLEEENQVIREDPLISDNAQVASPVVEHLTEDRTLLPSEEQMELDNEVMEITRKMAPSEFGPV